MFKIIKNFHWIIGSSFLSIFLGILTFYTFIDQGPIKTGETTPPEIDTKESFPAELEKLPFKEEFPMETQQLPIIF